MKTNQAWDEEWEYSKKFMPEIIDRICDIYSWGNPIIDIADFDSDVNENTDLFLHLRLAGKTITRRIAVRVRKPKFICYVDEITVRNILALNGELHKDENGRIVDDTEYQKLRKGYGDLECYCIAAPDDIHLSSFYMTDLDNIRDIIEFEAGLYNYETTYTTMIGDTGKINARWKNARQRSAKNTGCGFLWYKKNEIPGTPIADFKNLERRIA